LIDRDQLLKVYFNITCVKGLMLEE
jgi:hypothetical protein